MAINLTDSFKKVTVVSASGAGFVTAIWSVFVYIYDTKSKFDSAQEKIAILENQVKSLNDRLSGISKLEGLKGDKGDRGDRGFAGERGSQGVIGPEGPQGPKGDVGITKSEIQRIVEQAILQRTSSNRLAAADIQTNGGQHVAFQRPEIQKGCISKSAYNAASTLVIKYGTEFCADDGELLAKVDYIDKSMARFMTATGGQWSCIIGNPCIFSWAKERVSISNAAV